MAKRQKSTRFSIKDFDMAHYRTTESYVQAVDKLFVLATTEITNAASKENFNPDKPFSFDDYPKVKAQMQKTIASLTNKVQAVVETGSKKQWLFSCKKNDSFIKSIFDTTKLKKSELKKMQDRNLDALSSFQARKVSGLKLSQRVWKYTNQFKQQIEHALDVGLGEGRSAQELSMDVRQNLNDPNRLFRRVRDKRGNLVLSKAAQAFHPGQGVYRSSYKNAMRLTRSEINMAYRESDWQRWQNLDFVVGFEIMRSNHEPLCKCSTCEKLVGRYPKTFKFVGWHPQCMCFAIPIMEDFFSESRRNDRVNRLKAALKGTEYKKYVSPETITKMPDGFNEWVEAHIEAQKKWSSNPYFIRDNFKNGSLEDGLKIKFPISAPAVDPLASLMPSIQKARELANKWGLSVHLFKLEEYVKSKDVDKLKLRIEYIELKANDLQTKCDTIRAKCLEWNVSTYLLDATINKHDTSGIYDAIRELENRVENEKREYNSYLTDARNAIKEANAHKIDTSVVQDDVNTVVGDIRNWFMGKLAIKQRLSKLLGKINGGSKAHPAIKKSYKTMADVDDTFKKINSGLSEKWFEHDDLNLIIETNPKNNGSTNMNGKIKLTQVRIDFVKSALTKIGNGKYMDITKDEADAMATFWHEITHNRNKPQWINGNYQKANFCATELQISYMELANEFVARKTLPEFYKVLGCSSTPYPQFMKSRDSTGYNEMVTNYDYVILKLNLDEKKVLDAVRDHLYNKPYRDQKAGLIDGLVKAGIKDKNGKPLKKSVVSSLVGQIQLTKASSCLVCGRVINKTKEQILDDWMRSNGII